MARGAAGEHCAAPRHREAGVEARRADAVRARRWRWTAVAALVFGMAAINFVWMPGEFLAGDPHAWREETRAVLLAGELNVPAREAQRFGEPGQYFVRNERNGLYYSKYGIGNMLFTLPPMWLQQASGGDITGVGGLPNLFLFNLWYIMLGAVLAVLLYALSAGYSRHVAVRVLFVIGVMYCTSLWFYQRAQSSELYQTILFTALFMGLVAFLRALGERGPRRLHTRAWACLAAVWVCAALLVLIRVIYGLLLPLIVLAAAYAAVAGRSWRELRACPPALACALLVPPALIVALLGAVNQVKFGAPWLTGYHQWRPELHWPVGRLADGLGGFLFSPRFSIFLYFPLLPFALLGLKRFAERNRLDAVAMLTIFAVFLLVLAKLPSWAGEWTYGPRYLLFILPVLSLPFLVFADDVLERLGTWRARAWALAAIASLGYSAYLQVQVNRLPFFTYYHARIVGGSLESIAYFLDHHVGVICDDLIRHRANLDGLPFFAELKRDAPPEFVRDYRAMLTEMIARGNLYWTMPPEKRR
ncbi:MAG: hypothetical protein HYX46_09420 [Betaproteobacteria bacterium]|nr:hypothetical protein [Betaproteobacteria bacterium]